jgi:valyl-tRNA synthetase
MSLIQNYDPKHWEEKIILRYQKAKLGNPEVQLENQLDLLNVQNLPTYTIIMPPPNLTGDLHMGHAFGQFMSDTLSRYYRQKGYNTLWFPGVDHAGIQMEGVIKKLFEKEGKKRKDVSKEEFLKKCVEKAKEWRGNQRKQATLLANSADYSREKFTLDQDAVAMVNYAFKKYWKDGLLYKKNYLVNWSVGLQTALSDVTGDIEYRTEKDPLITFSYGSATVEVLKPNTAIVFESLYSDINVSLVRHFKKFSIYVATVRPETIYGDVAVAIHPDKLEENLLHSYSKEESSEIIDAIISSRIKIVLLLPEFGVESRLLVSGKIEKEFGTGALKVTPACDIFDYELYHQDFKRYELSNYSFPITREGLMVDTAPVRLAGKTREAARLESIKILLDAQLILKNTNGTEVDIHLIPVELQGYPDICHYNINWQYEHNVSICERSKTVIEPLISEEFFLSYHNPTSRDGKTLKELGKEGVMQTNFFPSEYRQMADNFLDGINDWCISRDLTWGHKMPVWYNVELNPAKHFYTSNVEEVTISTQGEEKTVSIDKLCKVQTHKPVQEGKWIQEEKILDTWFSSCLWPLTTLGFYKAVEKISCAVFDLHGVLLDDAYNLIDKNIELFRYLKEAGIKCYYLTNATYESMSEIHKLDIMTWFDGGVASYEVGVSKPDKKIFNYLISKYDIDPEKSIYFEDNTANLEMGKKLGFCCFNVTQEENLVSSVEHYLESIKTDFEVFYPTQMMSTAKEIYYQWIVRMIVLGMYFTNSTPFLNLVITPTVLDGEGKKMSKSLGNGMAPEDAIEEYSSDSLRISLLQNMYPNRNIKFGGGIAKTQLENSRNFGNKLWNIARFFEYQQQTGNTLEYTPILEGISSPSQWVISHLEALTVEIETHIQQFEIAKIYEQLYNFIWNDFASWYIEYLKTNPQEVALGYQIFKELVLLLHPFMPLETEVLWNEFFDENELLAFEVKKGNSIYDLSKPNVHEFETIIEVVNQLRRIRGLFTIDPAVEIELYSSNHFLSSYSKYLSLIARTKLNEEEREDLYLLGVSNISASIDMLSYISDIQQEIARTNKSIKSLEKQISSLISQLENKDFLEKATEEVVLSKKTDLEARKFEALQQQVKLDFLSK